jgi:hypothetical protein
MRVLAGRESLPKIEADWLRGRDRELYLPLLTVLHGSQLYAVLERFLKQKAEEKRLEKQNSLEAMICKVVRKLLDEKGEVIFSELWESLREEVNGEEERRPNSIMVTAMNSEAYGQISKRQVSSILRDKLGMIKRHTSREGVGILIYMPDQAKLRRAYKKYGLNARMHEMHDALQTALE